MATTTPKLDWFSAYPLWGAEVDAQASREPTLLQFGSESFVDELVKQLAPAHPSTSIDLTPLLARYESFAERPPGVSPAEWAKRSHQDQLLRLYQPIHGRFYLVAASLASIQPGLPDHCIDLAADDKVFFVLRRIAISAADQQQEQAWVGSGWVAAPAGGQSTAVGEQEFPLAPLAFITRNGTRRRLLIGFIPTSSRESYEAAELLEREEIAGSNEARARIILPLEELVKPIAATASGDDAAVIVERQKEASRFLLVDIGDFLNTRVPTLWARICGSDAPGPKSAGSDLYQLLSTTVAGTLQSGRSITWREALEIAWKDENRQVINGERSSQTTAEPDLNLYTTRMDSSALERAVLKALGGPDASVPTEDNRRLFLPKLEPIGATRYTIRCVYRSGRCLPLRKEAVSRPSAAFTIAPYYDPDAPARTIRIALPKDTSISGLRKFRRNVAFIFSDKLVTQMSRAGDLNKLLKGQMDSGTSFDLGWICSFSIPIITLCATIVLMIFISLLNIIFWWKPFLKICLPAPKVKEGT